VFSLQPTLTLAVLAITLALMALRPKGMHEAWAAVIGASLMLALRLETPRQAWETTAQGASVLLFLFALMLLSALLDRSGFFEWAAIHAAKSAKGDGVALYRNVFLLGSAVTIFLSLDTTAIIFTPVVLAFVKRLSLKPLPFLLACAFIPNTASLLLPVSNLTNLLFQSEFHFGFGRFALTMALPQVVAIVINYLVFRWMFKKSLPSSFDPSLLPQPASVIPDPLYFKGAFAVLSIVLVGYFVAPSFGIQPYEIALGGCVLLLIWATVRKRLSIEIAREISWSLFPFVVGLFILVRGVENVGLVAHAASSFQAISAHPLLMVSSSAFGSALGSNLVNNVPMALMARSVLSQSHAGAAGQYGALLGCNLGPNLTLLGSLATVLVISTTRKKGENITAGQFFKAGLLTTPLMLLASSAALYLVLSLFK